MVAIIPNMLLGAVFGFRSIEDFTQISRILNNVNRTEEKLLQVCYIACKQFWEKKPSHLILYTICFQVSRKKTKKQRKQKAKHQQNSELLKFFKKVLFKQQFKV